MKSINNILILLTILLIIVSGCKGEEWHSFVVERTKPRKYPFSGIGLLRENPNDTIEIFYSNATPKRGVNEVLTAKFAADTVVGMNESWVMINFGKQFGREEVGFRPNYNDGQYFKICNRGKGKLFYFIVPNPKTSEDKYWFYSSSGTGNVINNNVINNIVIKEGTTIYDLLYSNGILRKEKIAEVAKLFKQHDQNGNTLFVTYLGKPIKYYYPDLIGLNRSSRPFGGVGITNKKNGKGFYYGTVYANECMLSGEYNGGIMLQRSGYECYNEERCSQKMQ